MAFADPREEAELTAEILRRALVEVGGPGPSTTFS